MKGSNLNNQSGTYGTIGVSANANTPGARGDGSTWTDNAGNLWLFGGYGWSSSSSGVLNDLWKYNPGTNQWTWIKGSSGINQAGVYGTQGVASTSNNPGSRVDAATWTDASGNLWLFGGHGYTTASLMPNYLNDLWKYNPGTNEWTWISGSSVYTAGGVYGTKGTASVTNIPGSRKGAGVVKDANGNVWIFGGTGCGSSSSPYGCLNDLWKYNQSTGQWTWMSGSQGIDNIGVYGTLGVSSSTNSPGSRTASNFWDGGNGYMYVLGGYSYASNSFANLINDMWRYNITLDEWTWIGGSSSTLQPGVYGLQGVASLSNTPGARMHGGTWKDNSGNLWMFGGSCIDASATTTVNLNDIWKYESCSTPATPTNLASNNFSMCSGNSVTLQVSSEAPVIWYNSSNMIVGTGTNYFSPPLAAGNYTFFAEANLCNPSSSKLPIGFTVNITPTLSVNSGSICSGNSFTIIPAGAFSYSISGGLATVAPVVTSTYAINGTGAEGCPAASSVIATVSVYTTPTVSIISSATVCSGITLSLGAVGANSYTWSTGSTSATIMSSPGTTTSYSLTGASLAGCSHTAATTVTVYPSPTIAVNSGAICQGQSFTIAPVGAPVFTISGGNMIVNPVVTTAYTVTGYSNEGCVSSNSPMANIQVKSLPTLTLSGANSLCQGSSITLLVNTPAISYTWSNGSTSNLVVLNPTLNTVCSVTVTGSNGCTNTDGKIITVNSLPTVSASVNDQTICVSDGVVLSGLGAVTYSWTGNVQNNTMFYPASSATYTVTGFDANGCSNTAAVSIIVNPLPILTYTSSSAVICSGEAVSLTAFGASTYTWNGNLTGTTIIHTPTNVPMTHYLLNGTDTNGCVSTTVMFALNVQDCVGAEEFNMTQHALSIYPNPNKGEFMIRLNAVSENGLIEIYNSLGELVLRQKLLDLNTFIDLKNKANGIYTVILREKGRNSGQFKLIKE